MEVLIVRFTFSSLRRIGRGIACAAAFTLLSAQEVRAAAINEAVEYRMKAAYLYNFSNFVEWPGDAADRSPFLIGVIDPEGTAARIITDALAGKFTSDGRPIVVRHFHALPDDIAGCHQLFITRAAGIKPAEAKALTTATSLLLIGETDNFAGHGGVIGLVVSGNSVRCEVNLAGAQRAGVKLSGRLASVARLVRETTPP
jgi:hypothetical protein